MDVLAGLNPAQQEAVLICEGPLLILAGPGSGKTRVIAHRIAHLIANEDYAPWRVLAVTFTNKAARELRERVYALLGPEAESIALGTFHAICSRILRVDGGAIGVDRGFTIYDDADQMSLIRQTFIDLAIDPKRISQRAVLSTISKAKSELVGPGDFGRAAGDYFQEVAGRVYHAYQDLLDQNKALDFDDLITRTVALFRESSSVLAKYQERYRSVLVDEFQDTNVAQYQLTRMIAAGHQNICVVGDPDQSIYAWRSADIRNILNFEHDYPETRTIMLEQNYRSTQTILDTAQSIIRRNAGRKEKQLWTENGGGQPVTLLVGYDEQDEARLVAGEIEAEIKSGKRRPRDFAVMYRTNSQSRALEEALVARRLPYRLVGGTRFYQRREIKDVLAYLRVINNPFDSVSLLRIINTPTRGIGQKTLDDLTHWAQSQSLPIYSALQVLEAAQHGETEIAPPQFQSRTVSVLLRFLRLLNDLISRSETEGIGDLLEHLLVLTEYQAFLHEQFDDAADRWENVQELAGVIKQYEEASSRETSPIVPLPVEIEEPEERSPLASFLADVSLVSDVDEFEERTDAITLITLHAAKGLEFSVVFITGLEEGLMPHMRSIQEGDPLQMEEERRLCYVGVTRAKEQLYLTRAQRRMLMGSGTANPTSRFIKDIPAELITSRERVVSAAPSYGLLRVHDRIQSPADGWSPPQQRRPVPEGLAYAAGDKVRHAKFGEGIVIDCRETGADQEVTVAFKGEHGLKKLLLSFAPMERITRP
jgi:ATP-dependent DNA helicase UvrD/PcrA